MRPCWPANYTMLTWYEYLLFCFWRTTTQAVGIALGKSDIACADETDTIEFGCVFSDIDCANWSLSFLGHVSDKRVNVAAS